MNPISEEIVEKTWQELAQLEVDNIEDLINEFRQKQPNILFYLMTAGEDMLNQEEKELFLYLGIAVWQMMEQGERPLPKISPDEILEAEEANVKLLETLSEESEGDFFAVTAAMLESFNQIEILSYIVEALMESVEEDIDLDDDSQGWLLICLKSVVDALDAA